MSKTVKWIISVLIALLLVCAVVSVGFIFFSRFNGTAIVMGLRDPGELDRGLIQPWDEMPLRPDRIQPWRDMPMHPYRAFPGRMLPRIFPFGGFFGILLCLGFVFLLLLGGAALIVSLTRSNKPAPAAVTAAPPAPLPAASEPEFPTKACPSCQHPVNDDWSHCPYCGTALAPGEQAEGRD